MLQGQARPTTTGLLGLSLAAALSATGPARAQTPCSTPEPGLLAGVQRSHWQESDAQGRRLLRERGTLHMGGLALSGRCADMQWQARWTHSQGRRAYDGQSSTQAPVHTSSDLRVQRLALQGWWPASQSWAVGARLDHARTARNIASSANARGYPERFDQLQFALGARYHYQSDPAALPGPWRLGVAAWLGAGPGGQVRVSLPGFDRARLPLGAARMAALELSLDGGAAPGERGWALRGALGLQHERLGAGSAQTLTRAGAPAGLAHQPRIDQRLWSAQLQVSYRF